MDGTVNDFFNEIDQIAPPKENKNESAWQECYDSSSGYSYYWNVKTDKVTWEMPEEYRVWKEQDMSQKPGHLYVPPKSTPLFPSTALSTTTKIYEIQKDSPSFPSDDANKVVNPKKSSTNSKDQRIVLLSSYGDDSEESEAETFHKNPSAVVGPQWPNDMDQQITVSSQANNSNDEEEGDDDDEDDDDDDLLTRIQNRAKVLKDLGGELPPDIKKLVEKKDSETKQEQSQEKYGKYEKKDVTGFSLLAGYGDSDEEEEETKAVVLSTNENKTYHSTLFPISNSVTITQFNENEKEHESSEPQIAVESRAFHRKRRINIDFTNKKSKMHVDTRQASDGIEEERQGLGFKTKLESDHAGSSDHEGVTPKIKSKLDYPGFQSAGLMFVKSDRTAVVESDEKKVLIEEDAKTNETLVVLEETRKTLSEKLVFLSEGREPASPVQIMIIQMETLYEAMKEGGLTTDYLHRWLKETCSELIKLEKDAAPSGWLLQWDRINKRYYYRNQQTGNSQWEYPEPDIVGGDEAMDISTTPPPPIDDVPSEPVFSTLPVQPPPPPRIKVPTPPPPPTISAVAKRKKKAAIKTRDNLLSSGEIPPCLPSPPLPLENIQGEPPPPGVESSEIAHSKSSSPPLAEAKLSPLNVNDTLGSAINSFYSDLAALENNAVDVAPAPCAPPTAHVQHTENNGYAKVVEDKKKKKTKVKLVQGLAMKKKGVSKLVERWKNVQKDY